MAGTTSDSAFGRSSEGTLSGEALAEWRSSEQVENGIPSTSPPYWETDDDEDCGPKPSDMYGKYTWKIDKFSQINKRELRSSAFDVGSYKWYILIYPQGCDVCNHLSLFLCVANHDKLLPGWSHFAQFTIAVVNKDPKKSKYSDTLHRFWKKEHDWGWKKFMELSKVMDGFVEADTLIIKAQVQVIRERVDRPFRCLDSNYRRELVRVYLTNVEQICHRFMEERRSKLVKLIEDKPRWLSFCGFWVAIDQNVKSHMSREKTDAILRVITKHFFIEKEVTSTLVMDSLYSGLRALEGQCKGNIVNRNLRDAEDLPVPIVYADKDMFFLVDDVLKLLERVAVETLPPKDDKGPQNRAKDSCLEDCSKDSVARDERRLTELGHRTVEIFVLSHIFSKIEIAYKEAIALQRQEELIREEAAWLAETGQKAKRGVVSEKEKKLKKKQEKQKRNNRKGRDKGKTDKPVSPVEDELLHGSPSNDRRELMAAVAEHLFSKRNPPKCIVYPLTEVPSPDSEERDSSLASWDTDALETHPVTDVSSSGVSGHSGVVQRSPRETNNPYVVDDTSSTCSTDSVPSVVVNGLYSGYSLPKPKTRKSVSRVKSQEGSATSDWVGCTDEVYKQLDARSGASKQIGSCGSGKAESESKAAAVSTKGRKSNEQLTTKREKLVSLQRESSIRARAVEDRPSKEKATTVPSSASIRSRTASTIAQTKPESKTSGPTNPVLMKKSSPDFLQETEKHTSLINRAGSTCTPKPTAQKVVTQAPTNKPSVQPLSVVSRPLSAPIVPVSKPPAPNVSAVKTSPVTLCSESSARQLRPGPSPSYPPQSYKNVMMGITQTHPSSSSLNPPQSHTQTTNLVSGPVSSPMSPERVESVSSSQSLSFGTVNHDVSRNLPHSTRIPQREDANDTPGSNPQSGSQVYALMGVQPSGSERLSHSGLGDDFPHLDIINNLLEDEQGFMMERFQSLTAEAPCLQRHFSFPSEIAGMTNDLLASTSSYRFEEGCYNHGVQLAYGSLPGHFDSLELGDVIPQINPSISTDEQIDGFIPSPWLRDGSELSYYNATMMEGDGYPFNFIEHANMACGVMDYSAFGPPNAH